MSEILIKINSLYDFLENMEKSDDLLDFFIDNNMIPYKMIFVAIDKEIIIETLSSSNRVESYTKLSEILRSELMSLNIEDYKVLICLNKLKYLIDLLYKDEEEISEVELSDIEIPMNITAEYGGETYLNCTGLYRFDGYLKLCYCSSFNQYCIRFSSGRSRLFTVIGEYHIPVYQNQEFYTRKCQGNFMIDDYVKLVNDQYKSNKSLHIYTELSPVMKIKYNSNNIYRLLRLKDYLLENNIIPPNYEMVDLRYIDSRSNYNFFTNMVNKLDGITVENLKNEQKDDGFFKSKIMPLLKNLITKDAKYKLSVMYEPEHLSFLRNYYDTIEETFNSIRPIVEDDYIKKYNNDTEVKDILSDNVIRDIIDKYFYVIASIVDYYTFIQVFRKDYYADHIIFLVGDAHACQILSQFKNIEMSHQRNYHIYSGVNEPLNWPVFNPTEKISAINITGSFY